MKQTIVNLRCLVDGNQMPHFVPNVPSRPSLLIRVGGQVGTAFGDTGTTFIFNVLCEVVFQLPYLHLGISPPSRLTRTSLVAVE